MPGASRGFFFIAGRAPAISPLLIVGLLSVALCASAHAQGFRGLDEVDATGMSYHRFVRPGEASIELLLLGNTASGMYVIGADTEITELLALTGTSTGVASIRERRTVKVQLYRSNGVDRDLLVDATMQDILIRPSAFPAFQDGDILHIETRTRPRLTFFEVVRNASSIATLVLLVERLINFAR